MKGLSRFSLLELILVVAVLTIFSACDSTRRAAGAGGSAELSAYDWSAKVNGSGGNVTGGGFEVQAKKPEQLEKGNERRLMDEFRQNTVQAQVKASADILPDLKATPTPATANAVCPGGVCPYANAQPFNDSQGGRSSSSAWYNGFL